MNITDRTIELLPEDLAQIVNDNKEIQIYENNDNGYSFRDGRFYESAYISYYSGHKKMFNALKKHLINSIGKPKESTAYGDYTLEVQCPYCKQKVDLLDSDSGYDTEGEFSIPFFEDWGKFNKNVECKHCENTFKAVTIQR